MNKPLVLKLPWPPTVNHYKDPILAKSKQGKTYISQKLSDKTLIFRAEVLRACRVGGELVDSFGQSRIKLSVQCHPPDRRKRDMDNLGKSVQDSLAQAGIFEDDSQIDELHFYRKGPEKPGYVIVTVEALPTPLQEHWAGKTKKVRKIDNKPDI